MSFSCKLILKINKIRQPTLSSSFLTTLTIKEHSASIRPVMNQGSRYKLGV